MENKKTNKDLAVEIIAWVIVIVIVLGIILGIRFIKNNSDSKEEKTIVKTAIVKDSIYYADSIILSKLIPVLKKREGLALKPYTDGKYWYCYYGHMILPTDTFTVYTEKTADIVLWDDIRKAYFEVQRIERKDLYDNVFSVFVSGNINYKEK